MNFSIMWNRSQFIISTVSLRSNIPLFMMYPHIFLWKCILVRTTAPISYLFAYLRSFPYIRAFVMFQNIFVYLHIRIFMIFPTYSCIYEAFDYRSLCSLPPYLLVIWETMSFTKLFLSMGFQLLHQTRSKSFRKPKLNLANGTQWSDAADALLFLRWQCASVCALLAGKLVGVRRCHSTVKLPPLARGISVCSKYRTQSTKAPCLLARGLK